MGVVGRQSVELSRGLCRRPGEGLGRSGGLSARPPQRMRTARVGQQGVKCLNQCYCENVDDYEAYSPNCPGVVAGGPRDGASAGPRGHHDHCCSLAAKAPQAYVQGKCSIMFWFPNHCASLLLINKSDNNHQMPYITSFIILQTCLYRLFGQQTNNWTFCFF